MEISHMTPIPHICIAFPIIIATLHERGTFVANNECTVIHHYHQSPEVYIWIHCLKKKKFLIFDCIGSSLGTPLHWSARDSIAISSVIVESRHSARGLQ